MVNRGLHLVARLAIRLLSPVRAQRLVASLARGLPTMRGREAARDIANELEPSGTCLSRAMTVAARVEGADVAFGVRYASGEPLRAHAWVTLDGAAIRPSDPDGEILAFVSRDGRSRQSATKLRSDLECGTSNGSAGV